MENDTPSIVDVQGFSALSQEKSDISSSLSQLSSVNVINRESEMLLNSTVLAEHHLWTSSMNISLMSVFHLHGTRPSQCSPNIISLLQAVNPSYESRIFFNSFFPPFFFLLLSHNNHFSFFFHHLVKDDNNVIVVFLGRSASGNALNSGLVYTTTM